MTIGAKQIAYIVVGLLAGIVAYHVLRRPRYRYTGGTALTVASAQSAFVPIVSPASTPIPRFF
jgi:hypothetical protein